jgi:hypothetical protein
MVVTLLRREESRGAGARRQQERPALVQEAQAAADPVPTAEKRRTSRHAPEKPLDAEPGPTSTAGRKVKFGDPAGITMEPTPQQWCPLHETSLHDTTACRTSTTCGDPQGATCEACGCGGNPRLLQVWPAWPLVTRLSQQGPFPRRTRRPGRRPDGSPARVRCVPRPPGKGSPRSRRLPCHVRHPRKRSKGIPRGCRDNLRWGCLASPPWCDRAISQGTYKS